MRYSRCLRVPTLESLNTGAGATTMQGSIMPYRDPSYASYVTNVHACGSARTYVARAAFTDIC